MDPTDQAVAEALLQTGRRVLSLRREAGWSAGELAQRARISRDAVDAVEVGRADIGLTELSRLAVALGVPLSALVS